jgi:hypothetical protein
VTARRICARGVAAPGDGGGGWCGGAAGLSDGW